MSQSSDPHDQDESIDSEPSDGEPIDNDSGDADSGDADSGDADSGDNDSGDADDDEGVEVLVSSDILAAAESANDADDEVHTTEDAQIDATAASDLSVTGDEVQDTQLAGVGSEATADQASALRVSTAPVSMFSVISGATLVAIGLTAVLATSDTISFAVAMAGGLVVFGLIALIGITAKSRSLAR